MLEIVVLLGVAAVVGVLTVTHLAQADRTARVAETAEILQRTTLAINQTGAVGFRQRVGAHPRLLSQLSNPIAVGTPNSCTAGGDQTHSGLEPQNWSSWGPFGGYEVDPAIGLVTPIGIANNTMVRNPNNGGSGTLRIDFPTVDVEDMLILDQIIDGTTNGLAAGFVQWSAPAADGTTSGQFFIDINAAC